MAKQFTDGTATVAEVQLGSTSGLNGEQTILLANGQILQTTHAPGGYLPRTGRL